MRVTKSPDSQADLRRRSTHMVFHCTVKGTDMLSYVPPCFTRDMTYFTSYLHTEPLLKRVHSKRKEFAPIGSKFFSF